MLQLDIAMAGTTPGGGLDPVMSIVGTRPAYGLSHCVVRDLPFYLSVRYVRHKEVGK